jgi:hypothetical protein
MRYYDRRLSWYIFFLFFFTTCILLSIVQCMNPGPVITSYTDGNGNLYTVKDKTIEYIPVKPGLSSSGIYNGGEYMKKYIKPVEYQRILSLFQKAVSEKSMHGKHRVKMSGVVKIQRNNKVRTVIVLPGSEIQNQIEELLKTILFKEEG